MKNIVISVTTFIVMVSNAWAVSSVSVPMSGRIVLDLLDNQGATASAIEITGESAKALWDNLNVQSFTIKGREYKNGTNLSCSRVEESTANPTCRLVLTSDGAAVPTGQ